MRHTLLPCLALTMACATAQHSPPASVPRAPTPQALRTLPTDAPVAATSSETPAPFPTIPAVPIRPSACPWLWGGTLLTGGLVGGAGCLAGPCSDTLNPNPGGAPPQWNRTLKGMGQVGAAVGTPILIGLVAELVQCNRNAP